MQVYSCIASARRRKECLASCWCPPGSHSLDRAYTLPLPAEIRASISCCLLPLVNNNAAAAEPRAPLAFRKEKSARARSACRCRSGVENDRAAHGEGIFAGRPAPSMQHFLERERRQRQRGKLLQDLSGHSSKALARALVCLVLRCVLLLVSSDSDSTICILFRCSLQLSMLGTFWYYCSRVLSGESRTCSHIKVSTMYMCSICLLVVA